MEPEKLTELLHRLKKSTALERFFSAQREYATGSLAAAVLGEIEQIQMEWLLSRGLARSQKQFARADGYKWLLTSLGVPVDDIDAELASPRTTPEWLLLRLRDERSKL